MYVFPLGILLYKLVYACVILQQIFNIFIWSMIVVILWHGTSVLYIHKFLQSVIIVTFRPCLNNRNKIPSRKINLEVSTLMRVWICLRPSKYTELGS